MSNVFQIRRATKNDAAEIGRVHVMATRNAYRGIYTDAYLENLSPEKRAAAWLEEGKGHLAVNDPNIAVFVAVEQNKIIGLADIGAADSSSASGCAELYAIYLDPAYIGKGTGKALFQACVAHAIERGFKSMKTVVLSRNPVARNFYERMQGHPLSETETLIETGGTKEKIITYQWPTIG